MKISIYSYINSVVSSALLFTCIYLFRRKFRFTHTKEISMFLFLYVIGVIRLLSPFDFFFAQGIPVENWYASVFELLFIKDFLFFPFPVSALIFLIFTSVSLLKLWKLFYIYKIESKYWKSEIPLESESLSAVNSAIQEQFSVPRCEVIKSASTSVPLVTGIWKKKVIVSDITYSYEELYYILLHEYTHIRHGDLWKKLLAEIFYAVFWYIPFSRFIKKDFIQTLEIRCDTAVLRNRTREEKLTYMNLLIKTMKNPSTKQPVQESLFFAIQEKETSMIERFQLMAKPPKSEKKQRYLSYFSIILVLFLFICSYMAAPVPHYEPEYHNTETDYLLTPDMAHIIYENGSYYVIVPSKGAKNEISPAGAQLMMEYGFSLKK